MTGHQRRQGRAARSPPAGRGDRDHRAQSGGQKAPYTTSGGRGAHAVEAGGRNYHGSHPRAPGGWKRWEPEQGVERQEVEKEAADPAPQTRGTKETTYHETFENSGFSKREGASASYHVSNSGSRTEAPRQGTQQALEWLALKESKGANHNWGGAAWNYPKGWPDRYWKGGEPCCPPQVEGRAEGFFQGALGKVFTYSGLEFEFTGSIPGYRAKPHWQPHPLPKQVRTRGARTGKGTRKQPQGVEDSGGEDQEVPEEPEDRKASQWFGAPTS